MAIEVKKMQIHANITPQINSAETTAGTVIHRNEISRIQKEILKECKFLINETLRRKSER